MSDPVRGCRCRKAHFGARCENLPVLSMDKNSAGATRDKFCYHVKGGMERTSRETDSTSEFMKEGAHVWGKLQLSAGERLCKI